MIPAHLARASSDHRQWYGLKPPAAMVSRKRDVSGETEVKIAKKSIIALWYICYVVKKKRTYVLGHSH